MLWLTGTFCYNSLLLTNNGHSGSEDVIKILFIVEAYKQQVVNAAVFLDGFRVELIQESLH